MIHLVGIRKGIWLQKLSTTMVPFQLLWWKIQGRVQPKVKKNAVICIAHSRKHASNTLPIPHKSALISASQPPATTDTGWCITRYACLLPQLLPGTHSSLTTEGRLRLSRPGCLVPRRGGLPIQRWSPT